MVAFDTVALIYSLNSGKLKNLTKKWLFITLLDEQIQNS